MYSWFSYLKNALKRELPGDPISGKEKKSTRQNLSNLKPFIKKFWKKGILGAVLIFLVSILSFPAPLINRFLIDKVLIGKNMKLLLITVLSLTVLHIILKLLSLLQKFFFTRFEQEVSLDIQKTLIDHTLHLPKSFFDSKDTGYLMSRIISDVGGLKWFFSSTIVYLVSSVFKFIGGAIFLIYLKWELALIVLLIIPGMVAAVKYFSKKSNILSHHGMEQNAKVIQKFQESLSSYSLIKSFSTERRTAKRITDDLRKLVDLGLERSTVSSAAGFLIGFFPEIARFAVLLAGGFWIINGDWTLGSLIAFQSYIGYVYGPAQFLASANINFQSALASLERVSALFDIVPEDNIKKGKRIKKLKGSIEFRDVDFSYDGEENILENISFRISPGEWVAIVGASGVGKTTLISLILNFYKSSKGEILFDSKKTEIYNLKDIRNRIGYVSQNPLLLSGSILKNLKYGNTSATEKEIVKASKIAGIDSFINSLPKKYNEKLGEKGVNLSEGQRQRLSLARALIKNPDIYILDEPTSALDHKIENEIFKLMPAALMGKTVLLISHRESTVKKASKVLFLKKKKLIAYGSHEKLLKQVPEYRMLMDS